MSGKVKLTTVLSIAFSIGWFTMLMIGGFLLMQHNIIVSVFCWLFSPVFITIDVVRYVKKRELEEE